MRTVVALLLVTGFAAGGCGQSVRRVPGEAEAETGATGGSSATGGSGGSVETGGSSSSTAAGAGGSATGGFGGTGAQPASTCASVTLTSKKPDPTRVLFVIKTSESLNEAASETTNASRWELTREALAPVLGALNDDVEAGVLYFPGTLGQNDACFHPEFAVPPALVEGRQPALLTGSLFNVEPGGEASTHDAFEFALNALSPAFSDAIVLVIDGAPDLGPSCQASEPEVLWASLFGSVTHAFSSHFVRTFVVGTFGSESERSMLSQLATIGGFASPGGCSDDGPTYCHFDLTTRNDLATELLAAITPISSAALTCEWPLPLPDDGSPPDLTDVRVRLTPSAGPDIAFIQLGLDAPCDGYGFQLRGEMVSLCPDACDAVVSDPGASLTISAGCSPPPL